MTLATSSESGSALTDSQLVDTLRWYHERENHGGSRIVVSLARSAIHIAHTKNPRHFVDGIDGPLLTRVEATRALKLIIGEESIGDSSDGDDEVIRPRDYRERALKD